MNTLDALLTDGLPKTGLVGTIVPTGENVLKEIWIAIRQDGLDRADLVGDGTKENPYDGSTAAKFDRIMGSILEFGSGTNTTIHLGPGLFRTRGGDGNSQSRGAWAPRSGQRIVGSGMFATTILLTVDPTIPVSVFGTSIISVRNSPLTVLLDGFTISDLTLDCGMDDQPLPPTAQHSWPQIMCAGIVLTGTNVTIRRVRFINFGTRTAAAIAGIGAPVLENFVCSVGGAPNNTQQAFNHLIEHCIFEQPFHSNGAEATEIIFGGGAAPTLFVKPQVMRKNYLNMEYINRQPYPPTRVARVDYTPGSRYQVIETIGPHNVKTNSLPGNIPKPFYVEISGANDVSPGVASPFNGRFLVTAPADNDGSSRILTIDMLSDPGGAPTGNMTLQDSPSPTLDVQSLTASGSTGTVTTSMPHKRMQGDWVVITGARDSVTNLSDPTYNGSFQVASVSSPNQFQVALPATPAHSPAAGMIYLDRRSSLGCSVASGTSAWDRVWGNAWIMTTRDPHLRKPAEWITLGGTNIPANVKSVNPFVSYFRIENVLSTTKLLISIENPFDLADYFNLLDEEICESEFDQPTEGVFGANFQPFQFAYSPLCAVERNRILHSFRGGYHDTWDETDHIQKNNYFYDVYFPIDQELWGVPQTGTWDHRFEYRYAQFPYIYQEMVLESVTGISPVTLKLRCAYANANPAVPVGSAVLLTASVSSDVPNAPGVVTNAYFDTLTSDYYLEVAIASNPFSVGNSVWQWKYFQTWRYVVEDNVIELPHWLPGSETSPAEGYQFLGTFIQDPADGGMYEIAGVRFYTFLELIFRGNIIRNIDNEPDPGPYANYGFRIDHAQSFIFEDNIIQLQTPLANGNLDLLQSRCGVIKIFNNQNMAGTPTQPQHRSNDTQNAPVAVTEDLMSVNDDWLLGF